MHTSIPGVSAQALDDRAGRSRRAVLRHLRPDRRSAAALAVAVTLATVLPLAAPQLMRDLVDGAIAGEPTSWLIGLALGYLAVAVAGQLARMLTAWLANRLAWDGTNRLRERLAGHALGLDAAFHGAHTPGEMIERVDGDVADLAGFVVAFLLDIVAGLLLLLGVLVVVCAVDPRLGAVLAAYCALIGYGMARAQRLAVPSGTRSREASAALYGFLEERLAAAEDIRANGAGEHVVHGLRRVSHTWYHAEWRAGTIGSAIVAATTVAFAAGTAIMVGLAAWGRHSGVLTVGTAVLLFQYMLMVRAPFERLIDRLREYQAAMTAAARVAGLLAERPGLPEPARPRPLPATGPLGLRFDRVRFRYGDGEPVLSDVTFELAPGETLGLVGRTGSGKSTIARLALRLYDPVAGTVRVGGLDLREADPASLRRRVAIVTQDVQLFAASVRDNLTLFRPIAGDDRLRAVLAEVGLGDWLARLPHGLDTRLGDEGPGPDDDAVVQVSAGEAQLIAFARALLTDPGLVVLDEPTSRLDPATERHVERAVDRLLDGRTGVIIAHRLASLSRVDTIAVVERGRIVEYGPRERLATDPESRFGRLLAAAEVRS